MSENAQKNPQDEETGLHLPAQWPAAESHPVSPPTNNQNRKISQCILNPESETLRRLP